MQGPQHVLICFGGWNAGRTREQPHGVRGVHALAMGGSLLVGTPGGCTVILTSYVFACGSLLLLTLEELYIY